MTEKPDLGLVPEDLDPDPMTQFRRWFEDAEAEGIHLANAVALATAGADGRPDARHVLLRSFDDAGFVFYTNYESRKARELTENPWAAFTVLWRELDRQITVAGSVMRTTRRESDAYFATRPREAQIGTWASPQSHVVEGRDALTARFSAADAGFPGRVPRPPTWGGYRLTPQTVEFWQARAFRLHDRIRYVREGEAAGAPSGSPLDVQAREQPPGILSPARFDPAAGGPSALRVWSRASHDDDHEDRVRTAARRVQPHDHRGRQRGRRGDRASPQ